VSFLAGPDSDHMTWQEAPIDGDLVYMQGTCADTRQCSPRTCAPYCNIRNLRLAI